MRLVIAGFPVGCSEPRLWRCLEELAHRDAVPADKEFPGQPEFLGHHAYVSVRDATSIIGEVQAAVARWTDFAAQAGVSYATRNQIARSLPTRAM